MSIKSATLFFSDLATGGTSNKQYSLQLEKKGSGYVVNYQHGPIGGTQQAKTFTPVPTSQEEADYVYEDKLNEKLRQGYRPSKDKSVAAAPIAAAIASLGDRTPYPIVDLMEVDESAVEAYLNSPRYWLQNKDDGHFCQIQKLASGNYIRFNKLGGVVSGGLPGEIVAELKKLRAKTFFMAGELMGNKYVAENLLELDGVDLAPEPYGDRFDELEGLIQAKMKFLLVTETWKSRSDKHGAWATLRRRRAEGGVWKDVNAPYQSAKHFKAKFIKTLSAVVIGKGHKGHNSATIGLHNGKQLVEVGRCSLNGKEHNEDVHIGAVVEVAYLYGTEGNRLYQPRLNNAHPGGFIRKDVDPAKCTLKQIIYKQGIEL